MVNLYLSNYAMIGGGFVYWYEITKVDHICSHKNHVEVAWWWLVHLLFYCSCRIVTRRFHVLCYDDALVLMHTEQNEKLKNTIRKHSASQQRCNELNIKIILLAERCRNARAQNYDTSKHKHSTHIYTGKKWYFIIIMTSVTKIQEHLNDCQKAPCIPELFHSQEVLIFTIYKMYILANFSLFLLLFFLNSA